MLPGPAITANGAPAGERAVLVAALANSLLAGGNAVGIRFSNRELDPLFVAGLRFALAAVVLCAVMAALKLALPRGRALAGALLFGLRSGAATACLVHTLRKAYLTLLRSASGPGNGYDAPGWQEWTARETSGPGGRCPRRAR